MTSRATEPCKTSSTKRQSKYATLVKSRDVGNGKRRTVFLRKVKQNGEDMKWNARAEQISRTDFLSRSREWKEEQARLAAEQAPEPEDEEMDLRNVSDSIQGLAHDRYLVTETDAVVELDLVEQFLSQQDQELEATLSMLEDQKPAAEDCENAMTDYGSDDDDEYERFLVNVLEQVEQNVADATASTDAQQEKDQDMDVIMG
ncbi:hypothetical protein MMC13_005344 [Lambiella insularis]|nr:hypothetical protein [Lambiella insularis]